MTITHFKSPADFRVWLETNHARACELWVGFYKKHTGRGGLTYDEAVEEALCFGWIDGIKKRVDEFSYTHRFTPRKPRSNWSRVNVARMKRLQRAGRVTPAGLAAFANRTPEVTGVYSFENQPKEFSDADVKRFQRNRRAWEFFQRQSPGYRRLATWWVMSAKKPETRTCRLAQLIAASAAQRRLGAITGGK